ncbi:MAG TPA: hypothetical protein VG944_21620 [Fimbriimonas sp.]|nr:hypothetical protein [Fimbriimonas sp.]
MQTARKEPFWLKALICSAAIAILFTAYEVYERQSNPQAVQPVTNVFTSKPVDITFLDQANFPAGKRSSEPRATDQRRLVKSVFRFHSTDPHPDNSGYFLFFDPGDGRLQGAPTMNVDHDGNIVVEVFDGYGPLLYRPAFFLANGGSKRVNFKVPEHLRLLPPAKQLIPDASVHEDARITATLTGMASVLFTLNSQVPRSGNLSLRLNNWTYAPGFHEDNRFDRSGSLTIFDRYAIDQHSADVQLDDTQASTASLNGEVGGANLVQSGGTNQLVLDKSTSMKGGPLQVTIPSQTRDLAKTAGHFAGNIQMNISYNGVSLTWLPYSTAIKGKQVFVATGHLADGSEISVQITDLKIATTNPKDVISLATTGERSVATLASSAGSQSSFGAIKIQFNATMSIARRVFRAVIPIHRGATKG